MLQGGKAAKVESRAFLGWSGRSQPAQTAEQDKLLRPSAPVSRQHRGNRGSETAKVPWLCLSNRITNIINILVFYGVLLGCGATLHPLPYSGWQAVGLLLFPSQFSFRSPCHCILSINEDDSGPWHPEVLLCKQHGVSEHVRDVTSMESQGLIMRHNRCTRLMFKMVSIIWLFWNQVRIKNNSGHFR